MFKGFGKMHDFGGGIPRRSSKLLFMVCFSILHLMLASSEPIPSDTDDFKNLLLNTDSYVDRSLQIKELLSGTGCCCVVLRPKGWGKTVNLKMLQRFFEVEATPNGTIIPNDLNQNKIIFTGGEVAVEGNKIKVLKPLEIATHKEIMKTQGTFPVIFLNFTGIDGTTYKDFQDGLKTRLLDAFRRFEGIRHSSNFTSFDTIYMKKYLEGRIYSANIIIGVNFLSKLLFRHFGKKVMIFVDDYDAPVINAYQRLHRDKPEEYFQVYYLMRSFYVQSFHLNEFVEKGLMTGMIKLHLLKLVYFYSFLDKKYSDYYGFHQQDLDQLLANVSFTPDHEKIKDWYGYKYNDSVQLYHPGSIIRYIENNGHFDYYWLDPNNTGINGVLLSDDVQGHLRKLSKGESIAYFANFTDVSNFDQIKTLNQHVFLFYSGFLTPVDGKWSNNDQHELGPANSQVKHLLQLKVVEWEATKPNVTTVDQPQNNTLEGTGEQFKTTLKQNIGSLKENDTSLLRNVSVDGMSTGKTSNQALA